MSDRIFLEDCGKITSMGEYSDEIWRICEFDIFDSLEGR